MDELVNQEHILFLVQLKQDLIEKEMFLDTDEIKVRFEKDKTREKWQMLLIVENQLTLKLNLSVDQKVEKNFVYICGVSERLSHSLKEQKRRVFSSSEELVNYIVEEVNKRRSESFLSSGGLYFFEKLVGEIGLQRGYLLSIDERIQLVEKIKKNENFSSMAEVECFARYLDETMDTESFLRELLLTN